jgi:hypothetical protein
VNGFRVIEAKKEKRKEKGKQKKQKNRKEKRKKEKILYNRRFQKQELDRYMREGNALNKGSKKVKKEKNKEV